MNQARNFNLVLVISIELQKGVCLLRQETYKPHACFKAKSQLYDIFYNTISNNFRSATPELLLYNTVLELYNQ